MASDGGVPISNPAAATMAAPKIDNSKSALAALPEELVSNIAIKLGTDDIRNLRLTCKDLEAKSLHEFATEYFTAKCVMFTSDSLNVLVNIAQSDKFRHYLHKVWFITSSVSQEHKPTLRPCGHYERPKLNVRQREAFLFYKNDQQSLQADGNDKKLLITAFSTLSRLSFLGFVEQPHHFPLTCYGVNTYKRLVGLDPIYRPATIGKENPRYSLWLRHVFQTVMLAVGKSGINTITHFATELSCEGLSPTDLKIGGTKALARLTKAFETLESVDICIRSEREKDVDSTTMRRRALRSIQNFASTIANAKELTLTSDLTHQGAILSMVLTDSVRLDHLTRLDLRLLQIPMGSLAAILCKLKSARVIAFVDMELKEGSWVPLLKVLQKLPALEHLHMRHLKVDGQQCYFLAKPEEEEADPSLDAALSLGIDPVTGAPYLDVGDEDWSDADEEAEEEPDGDEEADPYEHAIIDEDELDLAEALKASQKEAKAAKASPKTSKCSFYTGENHRDYDAEDGPRGYHICLEGQEKIQQSLSVFIKEYHIVGMDMEDFGGFGFVPVANGAGAIGGFSMTVPAALAAAAAGMPVPPPPQGGQQPAGGPAGPGQAAGQAAQAPGPPPPGGFGAYFSSLMNAFVSGGPPPPYPNGFAGFGPTPATAPAAGTNQAATTAANAANPGPAVAATTAPGVSATGSSNTTQTQATGNNIAQAAGGATSFHHSSSTAGANGQQAANEEVDPEWAYNGGDIDEEDMDALD